MVKLIGNRSHPPTPSTTRPRIGQILTHLFWVCVWGVGGGGKLSSMIQCWCADALECWWSYAVLTWSVKCINDVFWCRCVEHRTIHVSTTMMMWVSWFIAALTRDDALSCWGVGWWWLSYSCAPDITSTAATRQREVGTHYINTTADQRSNTAHTGRINTSIKIPTQSSKLDFDPRLNQ